MVGIMDELTKEEKDELTGEVNAGRKLKALIEHPGWSEVLLPRLQAMRQGFIDQFLTLPAEAGLNGFMLIQQTVNAVDSIIGGIDNAIAEGKQAGERLKAELKDE
jgi:hypothetical protein